MSYEGGVRKVSFSEGGGIFKGEVDTPLHTMIFLFYKLFHVNLVLIKKFLESLQP